MKRWVPLLASCALTTLLASVAHGQPTPSQRRQAATAYDEGRVQYRAGEFADAAQSFMAAYRLAPSREALIQAVKSYQRAEQLDRAGTLGLYLAEQFGANEVASRTAEEAIAAASEHFLRVDVVCGDGSQPCELAIDGRAIEGTSFFATPFRDVEVTVAFGEATTLRTVNGVAGGQQILEVASDDARPSPRASGPARFVPIPEDRGGSPLDGQGGGDDGDGGSGISRGWFITGAALSAAMLGVTLWSGVDTLAGVDEYEAMPSQERYDEGTRKESRTNVLIGATCGVAALTLLLAILTDWSGGGSDDESAQVSADVFAGADGAGLVLRGAL